MKAKFLHSITVLLTIVIGSDVAAQTQSIGTGCGANVGAVSGTVSINIDCGASKSDQLSVQYVRLFGAAEVPLLMTLFGQPEISSGHPWGKKFRTVLSPDGEENIVGTNVIQFFKQYSFRDARPLLTQIWTDVVQNEQAPSAISWLATAGSRSERLCYYDTQEADTSGYYSGLLLDQKLVRSEKSCRSTIRKFDRRVGFTFLVIQNDSTKPVTDVKFLYRQNYTSKSIHRANVIDLPEYLATNQIELLPDSGPPEYNLTAIYGAASETRMQLKDIPTDWVFAARIEPKEKLIALLNIYVANKRNLPAAYLAGIYVVDQIDYSIDGNSKSFKVREPSRERAARVVVPYGWASQ